MHVCCLISGCVDCIGESGVAALRSADCWPRFCFKELTWSAARIRKGDILLRSLLHSLLRSSMSPDPSPISSRILGRPPTEHTSENEIHPRPNSPTGSRAWSYSSHHVVIEQRVSCPVACPETLRAPIQPQNFRTRRNNKRKRCPYSLPKTTPGQEPGNLENQRIQKEGSAPAATNLPPPKLLRGMGGNSKERPERRKALRRTTGPCSGR